VTASSRSVAEPGSTPGEARERAETDLAAVSAMEWAGQTSRTFNFAFTPILSDVSERQPPLTDSSPERRMTRSTSSLSLPGQVLWRMPARFGIANLLGAYSLRCVLFHNVSETPSPFTDGLGITLTPDNFERRIRFLATHYTPVSLETFLAARQGRDLPRRPVLVTFDDAYASVAEHAAPICQKYDVPAVSFVTAAFVGNQDLALDNLVCFIANRYGFAPIQAAANEVLNGDLRLEFRNLRNVAHEFVPQLSLAQRSRFKASLVERGRIHPAELASEAKLYLTVRQLRGLLDCGFEIGNHTYSHARCRVLRGADFDLEIGHNQRLLEEMTGRLIRAFSVPYGSRRDLTPELVSYLRRSGHEAAFLVDSLANTPSTDLLGLYRVSIGSTNDADTFSEVEILPRLRAIRDAVFRRKRLAAEYQMNTQHSL
jgi:peptidoglycan/xylan/chitin deacetylase (PgdA/CDA1 family)